MKSMRTALQVIRRRWFAVSLTFIVGFLGVLLLLVTTPKTYEAAAHVLIVSESGGRDPSVTTADLPTVASSTVVLGRVLDRLHLGVSLIKLKKAVKVRVGARSSIMEISYRDEVADRAIAVSNAVADELARYYEQISTGRANETVRKLDLAIGNVQQRLRQINAELSRQSALQPFLGSDKALDAVTTRLDDLELQRQLAGAALTSDLADVAAVSGDSRHLSNVARHEMLQNDPLYRNLVEAAARDGAELATGDVVHTRSHPENEYLEPKVRGERASVDAEARRFLQSADAFSPSLEQNAQLRRKAQALVLGDRARIAALDRVVLTGRARLAALPRASVTYAWLRLQLNSAQTDYLTLMSHRNVAVASRAEALSLGSVVVIDRAVRADTASVGLGRVPFAAACSLFVLALALASAFLIEMLDPSLRRTEQIESLYGAPLLASLSGTDQIGALYVIPRLPSASSSER